MLVGCGFIGAEENCQSPGFCVEFGTEGGHIGGLTTAGAGRNQSQRCCEDGRCIRTEKAVLLIAAHGRKTATFHFVLQMKCRYQCGTGRRPRSIFIYLEIESVIQILLFKNIIIL